jgi:hypothetical protein
MTGPARVVVPGCCQPDSWHDPPGPVPAAYAYEYREPYSGLSGYVMVLCVACCAKIRLLSETGQPSDKGWHPPPATKITVLRDANTLERVI